MSECTLFHELLLIIDHIQVQWESRTGENSKQLTFNRNIIQQLMLIRLQFMLSHQNQLKLSSTFEFQAWSTINKQNMFNINTCNIFNRQNVFKLIENIKTFKFLRAKTIKQARCFDRNPIPPDHMLCVWLFWRVYLILIDLFKSNSKFTFKYKHQIKAQENISIKVLKDRLAHLGTTSTEAEAEIGGQPFKIHKQGYFLIGLRAFSYRQKPQDKPVLNRLVCTLHNFETNSTCIEQIGTKFQTGQEEACGQFAIDYTKNNVTQLRLNYDSAGLVQIFIANTQNENAKLIACAPTGKLRENSYDVNGYLFNVRGEIKKGGKGISSIRFSAKILPKFDPEALPDEFIKAPTHKTELVVSNNNKGKGSAFDITKQYYYISSIQGTASPQPDGKPIDICGLHLYLKSPYDAKKNYALVGESISNSNGFSLNFKEIIQLDYSKVFVSYVRLGYDSKSLASISIFTSDGRCHKLAHSGQKIIRFQEHVINGILVGFFGMHKPGILSMGLKYKKVWEIK